MKKIKQIIKKIKDKIHSVTHKFKFCKCKK